MAEPGFDEYVVLRSGRLLRTAYLLTQDSHLAEDLLQTTLTRAWFAWARIDGDPTPYVRKVLINTFTSGLRRRWNSELPTESLPEPGYHDPPDRTDLRVALLRLPKRQRAVIVLRYFDDLTEVETAQTLGCSVGTVKSQANKALARLRVDPALEESR